MELKCVECGHEFSAEEIDLDSMTARCPACGTHNTFEDFVNTPLFEPDITQTVLQTPKGYKFSSDMESTTISYPWFSWRAPVYLASGIGLIGIPLMLLNVIGGEEQQIQPIFLPILFLVTVFGVGLTYFSLAHFLNNTRIRITLDYVSVTHGPIPVPGNATYHRDDVERVISNPTPYRIQTSDGYSYEIQVHLKDGTQHVFLKGFQRKEDADFIRKQITMPLTQIQA